ncbi:TetR family transcriptional regulator [Bacillus sp. REN10]|uniref:TetR family transcriptional regulator n=1 Tax=Bacillus sp. REN10 TaxID=2782541 RepID=UPI00193B91E4|nr:TetR family transcriptional regulator [Bacillus sp. REN10]
MSSVKDGKYNKILQAAISTISQKGLDKTSISDIVKMAGVAQGTFYLYFPSKKALIPAIAENLLTMTLHEIKTGTENAEDFWEIVRIMIDETFKLTKTHKEVIVLCYSGLAIDHSMEKWEAIYQPYYHWLESILDRAVASEDIVGEININWTAKIIINLIESAAERFYISEDESKLDAFKEETYSFLKRSLT